jgi:hypothetical protein
VIVKQGEFTGHESQDAIRAQYAEVGVFYRGKAVWDKKRGTWWVDRSQLIEPEVVSFEEDDVITAEPPGKFGKSNAPETKDSAKIAGQGTVTTYNAAHRAKYERKIKTRSREAVEKIKKLRESNKPGAAVEAWEEAKSASAAREAARDAAREKLTPSSKALSEQIDLTKSFDYYADKYSSPPETRGSIGKGNPPAKPTPQTADAFQVAEDVAKAAGKSRGGLSGLLLRSGKWLGPIGIAVGVGLAANEIAEAPPGQGGRVASREIGAFFGGLLGAELGAGAGVALAGGVSGFLIGLGIVSGPVGWLAIALSIVGGIAGAWAFGKLFGNVGEGVYELAR